MHRRRKLLIPIIIGLVIITIGIVVALIVITRKNGRVPVTTNEVTVQNTLPTSSTSSKPKEKIDLTNVEQNYSDAAISFADGLSSTKKMEEFLESHVDVAAYAASTKTDSLADFITIYDAVEKEEGEKVEKSFKEMVSKNDTFEVVKMTDIEELDEEKIFTASNVTIRNSSDAEATFKFTFYEEDIVIYIEDANGEPITNHSDEFLKYFVATTTEKEDESNKKTNDQIKEAYSKMGQQEKDIFNGKLMFYEGTEIKGKEVKSMLDVIIANNEQFVGTDTKFVAVYANISEYDGSAKLESVSNLASPLKGGNSSEANVKACAEEIENLKSKIDADKFYSVEFGKESGFIVSATIKNSN